MQFAFNVILEPKAIESIKAFITSSFSRKRESIPRYTPNSFCHLYRNTFSYILLYTITYKPRNLCISGCFAFLARSLLYTDCSENFRTANSKPQQRSQKWPSHSYSSASSAHSSHSPTKTNPTQKRCSSWSQSSPSSAESPPSPQSSKTSTTSPTAKQSKQRNQPWTQSQSSSPQPPNSSTTSTKANNHEQRRLLWHRSPHSLSQHSNSTNTSKNNPNQ